MSGVGDDPLDVPGIAAREALSGGWDAAAGCDVDDADGVGIEDSEDVGVSDQSAEVDYRVHWDAREWQPARNREADGELIGARGAGEDDEQRGESSGHGHAPCRPVPGR